MKNRAIPLQGLEDILIVALADGRFVEYSISDPAAYDKVIAIKMGDGIHAGWHHCETKKERDDFMARCHQGVAFSGSAVTGKSLPKPS